MGSRNEADDDQRRAVAEKNIQFMKNVNNNQVDRFKKLEKFLKELQAENFTGYIRVNFSQGSIARVEKFEEVLKK